MQLLVAAVLVVTGVVHLLPLTGVRSGPAVAGLYDVPVPEAGTTLLLRHRAVLLGLVGLVCLAGAVDEDLRALALAVGIVSTGSYVLLGRDAPTPALRRVRLIDVVLLVLLVVATLLHVVT